MTESNSAPVVNAVGDIAAKRQAEVVQLREELQRLTEENILASTSAEEQITISRLDAEAERIRVELAYQKRLKAAREGVRYEREATVAPAAPETPAIPVQDPEPGADDSAEDGKPAKANGKGK